MQTPETPCMASVSKKSFQEHECKHRLMTINEIINGSVNFLFISINQYFEILGGICWSFKNYSRLFIEY